MDRDSSPDDDYGVGYIREDQTLSSAEAQMTLLQIPDGKGTSRGSLSSSVTDLSAPIYSRERAGRQHVSVNLTSFAKSPVGIPS
ncbi:hypothetical protein J437_LFUL005569 [Ladona fulva]|uniref:Uncharacterized protein n=1 Tax=Ladona fulva TaxID=123851 RepID=A0A8K0K6S6_LADFU|nr:hypothetical protein J437_LFUL005569 [Ladona fulva]